MPATVKIDQQRRLVYIAFSGELNDEDLVRPISMIRSHPNFDSSFSEIVDFSGVTEAKITSAAVRSLTTPLSLYKPDVWHVLVAPSDLMFGMARMFQTLAEKSRPNVAVMRTLAEAYELLGIAPLEQ